MDGLTLLKEARAEGLRVSADGDRLVIRGPRRADAVARGLLFHKTDVLVSLEAAKTNAWDVVAARRLIRTTIERLARACPHGWRWPAAQLHSTLRMKLPELPTPITTSPA